MNDIIGTMDNAPITTIPKVIILEGIFILYKKSLRDMLTLKVFVDLDSDDRLARMVIRDTRDR